MLKVVGSVFVDNVVVIKTMLNSRFRAS